jgi:hypothetical protein
MSMVSGIWKFIFYIKRARLKAPFTCFLSMAVSNQSTQPQLINVVSSFPTTRKKTTESKSNPLGPGCFLEVLKILPLLTQRDGSGPVFDIVAPSLPNFGFSQGVSKRGFTLAQYAETCHKLMLKLGYTEYVTQGGDWGFWSYALQDSPVALISWIYEKLHDWTDN